LPQDVLWQGLEDEAAAKRPRPIDTSCSPPRDAAPAPPLAPRAALSPASAAREQPAAMPYTTPSPACAADGIMDTHPISSLHSSCPDRLAALTSEQREVVRRVIAWDDYTVVVGMPGAGKTTTVVTLILVSALISRRVSDWGDWTQSACGDCC